jgi:hypothetical protein
MKLVKIVAVFVLGVVVALSAGPGLAAAQPGKKGRPGQNQGKKQAPKPGQKQGPKGKGAPAGTRQQDQALVHDLQKTAHLLSKANRDYKGHRAAAVKHIVQAIHHLKKEAHLGGSRMMSDYKGPEAQPVSDAQLKQAAGNLGTILKQLNRLKTSMHRGKAAQHIGKAIGELQTALKIA